jgi:hypothetical protein
MSTVRIQVRRGTASEWTSANPTLAAGEMGVETDTRKLKVGTGSTAWTSLSYIASDAPGITEIAQDAIDQALSMGSGLTKSYNDNTNTISLGVDTTVIATNSYVDNAVGGLQNTVTSDYVLLADVGNAGGPAKLDVDGNLLVPKSSIVLEGETANAFETTLTVVDPTADRIITFPDATTTVVGTDTTQTLSHKTLTTPTINGGEITEIGGTPRIHGIYLPSPHTITFEGATNNEFETVLATVDPTADRTITLPDASGIIVLSDNSGNVVVSGNLTVDGTTTTVNSTEVNIQNAFVFEGSTADAYETTLTVANPTADRTITLPDNSGTVALVSDLAEAAQDAVASAVTVANGLTKTYVDPNDTLELGIDYNTIATTSMVDIAIGNIESDLETFTGTFEQALDEKAPSVSPAFTGTVTGITATMVGLGNVDNTSDLDKPISDDTQDALDLKADLTNATFTGTVVLTENTSIGSVTSTEIGYLEGVTEAIQTQLNAKLSSADAATTYQAIVSGVSNTEIGYLDGLTGSIQDQLDNKQAVVSGVSNTEIGYLDGVTGAIQGQLDDKAPIASPTFTGTVSGVTATHVGLGNVDNTSDANKPVSTATQTALDLKQDKVSGVSDTEIGYLNGVTSAIQTQLDDKSTASKTETLSNKTINDPTIVIGAGLGNITITNTEIGYLTGVTSNIQTQLDAKASLAGAEFTGNVEVDGNLVVDGDFTVNGTNFNASATSITIEDNLLQLAHTNPANTVDLGLVVAYNDGTAKHSGLARDVSDNKWKLFNGVTTEPATTVAFGEGSLDALAVGALEATTVTPSSGVVFSDGTQTKEGVPSRTPIVQKTASYALSTLTHRDSLIEVSSTDPTTITIPVDSTVDYPIGTTIDILQTNTGQVTIAPVSGSVTVNATPGLKLRTRWSSATLLKRAANTWVVYGDLTA